MQIGAIDPATLLLPNVNIGKLDGFDLSVLAAECAWDLAKEVLKRREPDMRNAI